MTDVPVRSFCVRICYPGKQPMLLGGGTSFHIKGAYPPAHEVDPIAQAAVAKWVAECLPDGTALPKIEAVLWGALYFVAAEDAP